MHRHSTKGILPSMGGLKQLINGVWNVINIYMQVGRWTTPIRARAQFKREGTRIFGHSILRFSKILGMLSLTSSDLFPSMHYRKFLGKIEITLFSNLRELLAINMVTMRSISESLLDHRIFLNFASLKSNFHIFWFNKSKSADSTELKSLGKPFSLHKILWGLPSHPSKTKVSTQEFADSS